MARKKNTRRFDPRYFMDEKTDIIKEELNEMKPLALIMADRRRAQRGPVSPERKLEHGEKCPPGYKLGLTDYCEKIGADPMEIDSAISRIEGKQGGGYGGLA